MTIHAPIADYSPFAWFYNRYLNAHYHSRALAALDQILLPLIPERASILDLCCGTGHLTQMLAERAYTLMGVDLSAEMLRYAEENVPAAKFMQADAREFKLPPVYHAAVCTFDSLNHMLSTEDLGRVFRNVHAALMEGGYLVFDLNTRVAYETQWGGSSTIVEDDHAFFVRGGFDPRQRLGRTEITTFRQVGTWQRSDVRFFQRCHSLQEVRTALRLAGFRSIRYFNAQKELGMTGHLGIGRVFFRARKRH